MKHRSRAGAVVSAEISLILCFGALAHNQTQATNPSTVQKETPMTTLASGNV